MFFLRMAAMAVLGGIVLATPPTEALACSCKGQFAITHEGGFEQRVPIRHFESHRTKGNTQTQNGCRRDARDQAHACMQAIWRDRLSGGGLPRECTGNVFNGGPKFRGAALPTNIKRDIERAVCCHSNRFANRGNATVQVMAHSFGGNGCGPNLRNETYREVTPYKVDCPAIRFRENCGPIVGSRLVGFDRPGFDIPPAIKTSRWRVCRQECQAKPTCRAWTWVPGDAERSARCWLKSAVPGAVRVQLPGDTQMVSGTVR